MRLTKEQLYHLYARTSFFAHDSELSIANNRNKQVDQLIDRQKTVLLDLNLPKMDQKELKAMSKSAQRELRKIWRQQVRELNQLWIQQMMDLDKAFIEKMTLFWHGHFACRTVDNPYDTLDLNNRLRENALGNFKDLLYAVSRSPAMINYLHLRQNKKGKPNEDFARELCELFTLGRDVDYTEADVKEIARAFTGWTYNNERRQIVNPRQHDDGMKTIFGKTGAFTGKDVLDMILENPKTANFIARKVYRFFVRERENEAHIQEIARVLYDSGYDIKAMMGFLLKSDWFYESSGELIKSPIELVVTLGRLFDLKYADSDRLIRVQRYLGQVLFDPPNVAGWAGGRSWIDSSRLAFRLRMGSLIVNKGVVLDELSPELDEMLSKKQRKKQKLNLGEDVDWDVLFKKNKGGDLKKALIRAENNRLDYLEAASTPTDIIHLISTPDFQLI